MAESEAERVETWTILVCLSCGKPSDGPVDSPGTCQCPNLLDGEKVVGVVPVTVLTHERQLRQVAENRIREQDRLIADLHARPGE